MTLDDVVRSTPWIPEWHETGSCMDRRHILWLAKLLSSSGVKRTLEIGVYSGASSAAFVEAGVPDAHFSDISPRPEFFRVVEGRGVFHRLKGCDVLLSKPRFDLVFVDGNHSLDAVEEEVAALRKEPPAIVVAHDINSTVAGYGACEGAHFLWQELQRDGWFCVVDAKDRVGELTKRGMLVATKHASAFQAATRTLSEVL